MIIRKPLHSYRSDGRLRFKTCNYVAARLVRLEGFTWALPSQILPTSIVIWLGDSPDLPPEEWTEYQAPLPDLRKFPLNPRLEAGQAVNWMVEHLEDTPLCHITLWGLVETDSFRG